MCFSEIKTIHHISILLLSVYLLNYWLGDNTLELVVCKDIQRFHGLIYIKSIMAAFTMLLKLNKLELDLESKSKLHSLNYSESHRRK